MFQCEHCPKKFTRKDNLSAHEVNFHNTSPTVIVYECGPCKGDSKEYTFKRNVTIHLRKAHFRGIYRYTQKLTKKAKAKIEANIIQIEKPNPGKEKYSNLSNCFRS